MTITKDEMDDMMMRYGNISLTGNPASDLLTYSDLVADALLIIAREYAAQVPQ